MVRSFCLLIASMLVFYQSLYAGEPIFVPVKVDGPVNDPATHSYWFGPFSECCSVLDVDGDGDGDLAAGRNWYEAPAWVKHANFRDGAETNGPETDNNSEFAMDVNRDGWTDIVSSGWMLMKGAFWYENPGKKDVKWKPTRIHSAKSMEGVIHGDIDGDGDDDILCNHWSLEPGQGMTWLEAIDREPWFIEHVVGTEGETHGNGLGDINGDGRMDIVTPVGWYEAPPKPADEKWAFHADYRFTVQVGGAAASHPILIYDVNQDGKKDIIIGAGNPDLATGKRLFAHHGRDVSWQEPIFAFWYDIQRGKFERHVLAFNHLPWYPAEKNINPPPNFVPAVGMKLNIADMDKNGRNDVVFSGKGGLYIFYNTGATPSPVGPHRLPREETYPSWRPWYD